MFAIGRLFSYLCSPKMLYGYTNVASILYAGFVTIRFQKVGLNFRVYPPIHMNECNNIAIGDNVVLGREVILYTTHEKRKLPYIIIGNNVNIGDYCHISSYNHINIGDNVLIGRYVSIIDNSHGENSEQDICISPAKRSIISKGEIIVEDNVWIGEKVMILGNVVIGRNAIIGAHSVVNRDVPPYTIVAGIPARVVKEIK